MPGPAFLNHRDSAVATEIAAFDWTSNPLGPVAAWPVSLRTTLATVLACPAPMFLAWGPELISFYNDAYRPLLGYRAETAMGQPFRHLWASVWDDIAPLVEDALAGRSRSVTDMRLDLSRTGEPEESYWSFSYSPAFDDEGAIVGMLCVTGETTARVLAERHRLISDERLQLALSSGTSIGAWDWDVVNDIVTADVRFAALYGVDPGQAARGAPIAAFFGGIHPEDRSRVEAEIACAMVEGGSFASDYRLTRPDGALRWVSAQGRSILDEEGRCIRFPGVSFDVTERKIADLALQMAKEEREFVVDLTARQRAQADAAAIIRLSTEAVGRRLGVNRVGFYRLIDTGRMRHGPGWSDGALPPLAGEQPVSAFGEFARQERSRGETVVFGDSRTDAAGALSAYADRGVLAGICVPLLDGDNWSAGIDLHHAAARTWTQAEVLLAKEVAGLTWTAVERAEALVRLAQRLDRQEVALSDAVGEIAAQATGRAEAEEQVRQLQKMEAVGQLTGGIAHDFNNMLAIIIGGLNLTQRRLARGDTDVGRFLDGAMEGATRAATLTQRLLAFARQQPLAPEPVDGNALVTVLTELLTRSLGELVTLETVLGADLWRARVDPNQLENAIVNLAVNARDAMPEGGRLIIETANARIDGDEARRQQVSPGEYVMFAVTDTGTGMSAEVMSRAFDPFFTTKATGKGTGLGLSQVFGFIRQSGGHVRLSSQSGRGTTVRLYLPRVAGEAGPSPVRRAPEAVRRGRSAEIVLVVEDEERVRNFSVEALRELGYTVIHAGDGAEGLAMIEAGQDVTLLFTDVVMPGMTGRDLADRALALRPSLKVLFTTGYTRDAVVHDGVIDADTTVLPKPFSIDQLAARVRDVLDA